MIFVEFVNKEGKKLPKIETQIIPEVYDESFDLGNSNNAGDNSLSLTFGDRTYDEKSKSKTPQR